ncbi:MAG: LysM peptidoglycan-binding domain-containing protein [Luteimonas sp.]
MTVSAVSNARQAPPSSDTQASYTIQRGDALSVIAQRHGVSLSALLAANPQVRNPDVIYPGDRLEIPGQASSGAGSSTQADAANGASGDARAASNFSISQRGVQMLEGFEGYRSHAYPDPGTGGAPWTIGYGHTAGVKPGDVISKGQAEQFLKQDLAWAQDAVRSKVDVPISQNQFDALVSLTYNLGANGYPGLLSKLNGGDYAGAQQMFGQYVHAGGHVMQGLVTRRASEAALFGNSAPGNGSGSPSAPAPSTPPTSGHDGAKNYLVNPGDTLSQIAAHYGVSLNSLLSANPQIHNPDLIHPGQTIHVSGGATGNTSATHGYTVRGGDTMSGIAARNGISLSALVNANPQVHNANLIFAGQQLNVPGAASSSGPGRVDGTPVQATTPSAPTSGNDGKTIDIAKQFLGRNASDLKISGQLPMESWVPNDVNCANFVTAVLQKAGLINFHDNTVSGTASRLQAQGWQRVPASQAKPGDVCILNNGGHIELVASNAGGNVKLIGSNNINADGSQQVSYGNPYGNAWYLTPP